MNRPEWIACLAKLTTPHDASRSAEAMMSYLPFLSDLPDAAFTAGSLEAVAMSPRRLHIADLSEVKGPLAAWWRDRRPAPKRIAAPAREAERAPPTDADRAAVAAALADFRAAASSRADVVQLRPVKASRISSEVLAEIRKGYFGGKGV